MCFESPTSGSLFRCFVNCATRPIDTPCKRFFAQYKNNSKGHLQKLSIDIFFIRGSPIRLLHQIPITGFFIRITDTRRFEKDRFRIYFWWRKQLSSMLSRDSKSNIIWTLVQKIFALLINEQNQWINVHQGQTASFCNKRSEATPTCTEVETDRQFVATCTTFTRNWFLYQLKANTCVSATS